MPNINPYMGQTMKNTATSSFGDDKWNLQNMFPDNEGISESTGMNELQTKGYNATSSSEAGGN